MTATAAGAITENAPAKINLNLHVCGRRPDGYHLLDSLVVFAGVGDRITVTPSDTLTLAVSGPFGLALANERDNLVLRAARLLAEATGISAGAHIVLEKNLPVASGIGGGSADAAATLKACAKLWNADLSVLSSGRIADTLGADVPVCLNGTPAFMSGIGEIVTPAPALPGAWIVLANPGVPLSTPAVFKALAGRFSGSLVREDFAGHREAAALAKALQESGNDLMAPAVELAPLVADVLTALGAAQSCLLARLSGSGPTCFGLFAAREDAARVAADLKGANPGWWTAAAPLLSR